MLKVASNARRTRSIVARLLPEFLAPINRSRCCSSADDQSDGICTSSLALIHTRRPHAELVETASGMITRNDSLEIPYFSGVSLNPNRRFTSSAVAYGADWVN